MGVVIRQSIASTIISYAGVAIGYVNLLYLYPRFLSPDQVGTMRTMQDAAILMAQFAQFGLAQSIIRFFPRFASQKDQSAAFMNLILLCGTVAFGLFLLVFFSFRTSILGYFQENASGILSYASLAVWLTFITVATTLLEIYSRSLLKNILPNLLKEVVVRLLLGIIVLLYYKEWLDFDGVMITSVLAYAGCLTVLMLALAGQGQLSFRPGLLQVDAAFRSELIRFSILSFAGTAGLIVIGKVDSLMVAGLLGLTPVAVYTTSFYMATVIEIPKRAITQVATPLISRGFEKNDLAEVGKLYHKTALNQFILGSLLLLGVAANLDSIFFLMPRGDLYQAGKWVVLIVGAGKLVDMLFGPSSELIVYSKDYAFNIVLIVLLAGMVVGLNNLLIPTYGIEGAAAGAALTLIIFNAVKFVFIWIRTGLQPFTLKFPQVAVVGAVTWFIQSLIPELHPVLLDMVLRSAAMAALFTTGILALRISPDANNLLQSVRQRMRGR